MKSSSTCIIRAAGLGFDRCLMSSLFTAFLIILGYVHIIPEGKLGHPLKPSALTVNYLQSAGPRIRTRSAIALQSVRVNSVNCAQTTSAIAK